MRPRPQLIRPKRTTAVKSMVATDRDSVIQHWCYEGTTDAALVCEFIDGLHEQIERI